MISTCSYSNFNSVLYKSFSISGNGGRDVMYDGKCYSKLAPKRDFWKVWHDNIGRIPEEENTKYYIEQYYTQVLSKLDPEKVYKELDCSTLLCYEDNDSFCHRFIVSAWFELLLDIEVPEVKITGLAIEKLEKPEYIKEYLEDIMKKNKNMRGFQSLRALYLFEKSEELEQNALEIEETSRENADALRQVACYYRCDADEAEDKYKENCHQKLKKYSNN
ncbi:MAG: hypothetical protein E7168_00725 [Firmicutes bacterium]|nr:hypothetical protein [Bacillota bacterium]